MKNKLLSWILVAILLWTVVEKETYIMPGHIRYGAYLLHFYLLERTDDEERYERRNYVSEKNWNFRIGDVVTFKKIKGKETIFLVYPKREKLKDTGNIPMVRGGQ